MDRRRRDFLCHSVALGACMFAPSAPAQNLRAQARRASEHDLATKSIGELSQLLAEQKTTSRQLVEQALAAIKDPKGEGSRTFISVHAETALASADRIDAQRRNGTKLPALAGVPISIKDLFDENGIVTLAGSTVLQGASVARQDSLIVERLRNAGAVIIGRTNLTEFALSGLGINPHYGTPKNTFDRAHARIPGGSSSGAAISVTDGMAAGAIGTDTGGSVRIPAALNGLVGFKPTARRVPTRGLLPLSLSLDSVGPIARSVADCIFLDRVLAEVPEEPQPLTQLRGLRFAVPTTIFHEDLSPAVANAFTTAMARLSAAGAEIVELPMAGFARAPEVNPRGILSVAEAYWWHRHLIKDQAAKYDPRVLVRIMQGEKTTAADYIELLQQRSLFIEEINSLARPYDALLIPTTPETAPTIAEATASDERYFHFNNRMLRNPSIVNLFDGCALSVPCHEPGNAPVGLMITGTQNSDRKILGIGLAVERVVRQLPGGSKRAS